MTEYRKSQGNSWVMDTGMLNERDETHEAATKVKTTEDETLDPEPMEEHAEEQGEGKVEKEAIADQTQVEQHPTSQLATPPLGVLPTAEEMGLVETPPPPPPPPRPSSAVTSSRPCFGVNFLSSACFGF